MRRDMAVILACGLAALLVAPVAAGPTPPVVVLNGEVVELDPPPRVSAGRVLVPFRGIFEALDARVVWDAATRQIRASKDDTSVELTIGSRSARVDGSVVRIDVAPQVLDGRTFVPLRFIGEALGAHVNWRSADRTVEIATEPPEVSSGEAASTERPTQVHAVPIDGRWAGKEHGVEVEFVVTNGGSVISDVSVAVTYTGRDGGSYVKELFDAGKYPISDGSFATLLMPRGRFVTQRKASGALQGAGLSEGDWVAEWQGPDVTTSPSAK